jgi:putative intracellular protease/amidase
MAPKVLFVLTSHDTIDGTGKPTGWYLPEFAHPYNALAPHTEISIASPNGGAAPLDPASVEATKDDVESQDFLKTKEAIWKNTEKLESFLGRAGEFEAIFYVGGHGPMYDLAVDSTSHALINEFYAAKKIVSAVCHGPAALVNVKLPSGEYLLSGSKVTGFSNSEETAVGLMEAMPFSLEDKLNTASGGKFEKASQDWSEKVVVDGKIITGQNPASAAAVGKAIYEAIFK